MVWRRLPRRSRATRFGTPLKAPVAMAVMRLSFSRSSVSPACWMTGADSSSLLERSIITSLMTPSNHPLGMAVRLLRARLTCSAVWLRTKLEGSGMRGGSIMNRPWHAIVRVDPACPVLHSQRLPGPHADHPSVCPPYAASKRTMVEYRPIWWRAPSTSL